VTITRDRSPIEIDALSDADAVARAEHLGKVYRDGRRQVVALDDVTEEFSRGRLPAIMGPPGSGRSTLMRCSMVTIEAVTAAVFGAVLGTALGLGLGPEHPAGGRRLLTTNRQARVRP